MNIFDHMLINCNITWPSVHVRNLVDISNRKIDYYNLTRLLESENWLHAYNADSCDEAFDNFMSILQSHIQSSYISLKKRNINTKLKP